MTPQSLTGTPQGYLLADACVLALGGLAVIDLASPPNVTVSAIGVFAVLVAAWFLSLRLVVVAITRRRDVAAAVRAREKLEAELTPRELEVLRLLAAGLDTSEVSDRLGIARHTTEWHVRHVIEKLHVHSNLQAVIAGARLGLVEL